MKVINKNGWYMLTIGAYWFGVWADSDTLFQYLNRNCPKGTQIDWEILP